MEADRWLPKPSQAQPQISALEVHQEPNKEVHNENTDRGNTEGEQHINLIEDQGK
jgi:hypothetical protein